MESFFLPKMLKNGAKLTSLSSPARNLKIYFCLAAILHALKTDENETTDPEFDSCAAACPL